MLTEATFFFQSVHDCDAEEPDRIDFTTDGLYSFDGEVSSLTYMESEVTGMEGTRTSIIVMKDQVVLDRDGNITSRMVFAPGEKTAMLYDTPYGSATLSINTWSIRKSFDENGGEMEIEYVLDVEHTVVSKNTFQIRVEKQIKTGERADV